MVKYPVVEIGAFRFGYYYSLLKHFLTSTSMADLHTYSIGQGIPVGEEKITKYSFQQRKVLLLALDSLFRC